MPKSVQPEAFFIDGPAGPLQALLEIPQGLSDKVSTIAIVCHPHPAHGGAMTNKVAHTLARAMNLSGFAALRFNFRGVGDSAGSYDEGRGELADALCVVEWAKLRFPQARLVLSGFSFGAAIALQVSLQVASHALVLIAPPVGRILDPDLRVPESLETLIVQGGMDEVVDSEQVIDWTNAQPGKIRFVLMASAGHFFHGLLVELRESLVAALAEMEQEGS